jgi:hypothetical protein
MFHGILVHCSGTPHAHLLLKSIKIMAEGQISSTPSPQVQSRAELGVPPKPTCETYTCGGLEACCMWDLSNLCEECAHSSQMSRTALLGHWRSNNFGPFQTVRPPRAWSRVPKTSQHLHKWRALELMLGIGNGAQAGGAPTTSTMPSMIAIWQRVRGF